MRGRMSAWLVLLAGCQSVDADVPTMPAEPVTCDWPHIGEVLGVLDDPRGAVTFGAIESGQIGPPNPNGLLPGSVKMIVSGGHYVNFWLEPFPPDLGLHDFAASTDTTATEHSRFVVDDKFDYPNAGCFAGRFEVTFAQGTLAGWFAFGS